MGGTSAAAPAWAGLVAITDQGLAAAGKGLLKTAQLQTDLYNLPSSDFHKIKSGINGYSATAGYNLVSGLGSPRANLLVAGLLAPSGVSPSPPFRGSPTVALPAAPGSLPVFAQSIGALTPQTFTTQTNFSGVPSTASSQQTSAAKALVQQSPTSQNALGQGAIPSASNTGRAEHEPEQSWLIDHVADPAVSPPTPAEAQPQGAAPNAENNRDQPQTPPTPGLQPAAPAILPVESAILLDRAPLFVSPRSRRRANLSPITIHPGEHRPQQSGARWQVCAFVATAAVAVGGYRLVLKETRRKRKSWLHGRISTS
jgi:hypothetical protein